MHKNEADKTVTRINPTVDREMDEHPNEERQAASKVQRRRDKAVYVETKTEMYGVEIELG